MKVGILAVQGDFEAHGAMLERLSIAHIFVRTPRDLDGLDALILPGGESTTQWKFLVEEGLQEPIREHAARGAAIFGTCAGAILLAKEVSRPAQPSLGLADISVVRNAYGRQLASDVRREGSAVSSNPIEMVFIRAPIVERIGPGVEVLASSQGHPVLLRQNHILIATFHPELTQDLAVHDYFIRMAGEKTGPSANGRSQSGDLAGDLAGDLGQAGKPLAHAPAEQ